MFEHVEKIGGNQRHCVAQKKKLYFHGAAGKTAHTRFMN